MITKVMYLAAVTSYLANMVAVLFIEYMACITLVKKCLDICSLSVKKFHDQS